MRSRIAASLLTLAVVAVLTGCSSGLPNGTSGTVQPVEVTILMTNVNPDVAGSFEPGQQVRAKESGAVIGSIESVDTTLSAVALGDSEGRMHEARSPISRDVRLTLSGEAEVSDAGFEFSGVPQYINSPTDFLTSRTQFLGIITRLESAE